MGNVQVLWRVSGNDYFYKGKDLRCGKRINQYWKTIAWGLGAGQVTEDCIVYTAVLSEACCGPFLSLSEYLVPEPGMVALSCLSCCHHLWSWGWGPCRPGAILGYIVSPRSLKYRVRPCLKHNKIKTNSKQPGEPTPNGTCQAYDELFIWSATLPDQY